MGGTGSRSVDLLIIGAGPGGLSTALHLVQKDPAWAKRLLLLEKAAHPRPKLCGGGVTRLGLQVLQDLGMPFPLPIPQAQVEDVCLVYGKHTVHVRGRPQFTVFHRAEFDAYLAAQARKRGVIICENVPAQSIVLADDGVEISTPEGIYHARVVVGADGSNGLSRRFFNHSEARSRVARLLEFIDPAAETEPSFNERFAIMDFTPASSGLQGYVWEFPSLVGGRPFFNFGVYDARVSNKRLRANLPKILEGALASWGSNPDQGHPAGHPIQWFSPHAQFAQPGVLLVGDAAGVDPLFGEGIGPALAYGSVAAQAVEEAFNSGDFSFRGYRRRVLASPVGKYLRVRSIIAGLCYLLSGYSAYMYFIWAMGGLLSRIMPPPLDLYEKEHE